MEVQRRTTFNGRAHKVGGYAQLTTVDRRGVSQQRLHEWTDDHVGALISPRNMDWLKWRAERDPPFASAKVVPMASAPMNGHQRRQRKALSA
jgi:hypothetical protein